MRVKKNCGQTRLLANIKVRWFHISADVNYPRALATVAGKYMKNIQAVMI